jgi:hypothetical protein
MRDTSPTITMARRRVASMSSSARSNGPSKVQTSGAGTASAPPVPGAAMSRPRAFAPGPMARLMAPLR